MLFQQYPLEFSEIHLDWLKIEIKKNKHIIKVDEAAFCHDRLIIPIKTTTESGDSQWDRHPAKKLLRKDVDEKKYKVMALREL
mmetsp:Transcript_39926/g.40441  ORF Transcript_39926/g.40441 Transcript_39926/m.40441 type:complete len:83 (+) Transcript_39926:475-723(+)